jgi:hypothetical protein
MFRDRVFWGTSTNSNGNTEVFAKALSNSSLASNNNRSVTITSNTDEYIYYVCPDSFGTPVFSVGGFVGGFTTIITGLNITNSYGYTTSYSIYKSDNHSLGIVDLDIN